LLAAAWECVVAGLSEVWPPTGGTAIRIESKNAMDQHASGSGEDEALISPLYSE
jgi:hypothetical protein